MNTDNICGLCGEPGADKVANYWTALDSTYWPGEKIPNSQIVHRKCEQEETKRAQEELTREQRDMF